MSAPPPSDHPRVAIGIDVGGTKIAGGLVDVVSGEVVERLRAPTLFQRGGEAVLQDTEAMLARLLAAAEQRRLRVAAAGIGVAELVDGGNRVFSSHRIAWAGLPVAERLSRLVPTVLEADVRAGALAEARFGSGRPFRDFLYVSVGTGISTALVQNGRPYPGSRGAALAMASGPTRTTCAVCGHATGFVLEDVASGPALTAAYNARASSHATAAEDVVGAAARDDAVACAVIDAAVHALGGALGLLANALDPAAIVVGGGLGSAPGRYWAALPAAIHAHLWAGDPRPLPVLQGLLRDDAGLIGAAVAALREPAAQHRTAEARPEHAVRTEWEDAHGQ